MAKVPILVYTAFAAAVAALCGGLSFVVPSSHAQLQVPFQSQFAKGPSRPTTVFASASVPVAVSLALVGVSAALALVSRRAVAAPARTQLRAVVSYESGKARFTLPDGVEAPKKWSAAAELGVQAPTGFWDPAGFCDGITEQEFKRLRSCEIKHGRLSMMATIGYIAPFYGTFEGYLSPSKGIKFADLPMGVQAATKIPSGGFVQILLFAALIEFGLGGDRGIEEWKTGPAGDYGKGFLGMFGPVLDPEKKKRSLNSEIANGRLAMVAITGMVLQEGVAGGTGIEMWVPPAAVVS